MAIAGTHPSTLPGKNPWTALIQSVVRFLNQYAEYRRKRHALARLRMLDARTLKDIAIDRSEISSIVHGSSRGRRRTYHRD